MKVTAKCEKSIFLPVQTREQAEELLFNKNLPNENALNDSKTLVIYDSMRSDMIDCINSNDEALDLVNMSFKYEKVETPVQQEIVLDVIDTKVKEQLRECA